MHRTLKTRLARLEKQSVSPKVAVLWVDIDSGQAHEGVLKARYGHQVPSGVETVTVVLDASVIAPNPPPLDDPLMLVGPHAPPVAYVDESHSVVALAYQREPTTGTASVGDYDLREFFDACVPLCYVSNDPAMGHDDEAVTHAKSMMNVMGHDNRGESLVAQS